jgi:cytochrome P450
MSAHAITLSSTQQCIPNKTGLPLLGCLPEFAKDPLAFFKGLMNEYPDVVEFKLPFHSMALVTDGDLTHQILVAKAKHFRKADRDVSIMGTILGNGLVTNNDTAHHKKQRKLVQPGFHFRRIESYAEIMADYSQRYVSDWQGGERDIADDMFKLTMYIVSKTLFNTDMSVMQQGADDIGETMEIVQSEVNKRFHQIVVFPDWVPTPRNLKLNRARKTLNTTIDEMIQAREKDTSQESSQRLDMMSMLLDARYEDGGKMDHKLVMDELITLFVAGHETTSNALTWCFYLLSQHPEIQQKVHHELDTCVGNEEVAFKHVGDLNYTEMVVKEAMRLLPPAWVLNTRQANEDIEVAGYHFPKDKVIFLSPYANHRNPKYFDNPDNFDPERFSPEREKSIPKHAYIPFGLGPRVCIGQSFAMMEAKIILATIMKRFSFELAPDTQFNPQALITLSNENGMRVKLSPRT